MSEETKSSTQFGQHQGDQQSSGQQKSEQHQGGQQSGGQQSGGQHDGGAQKQNASAFTKDKDNKDNVARPGPSNVQPIQEPKGGATQSKH